PRIDGDVLRFLLTELFDALVQVVVGDFRIGIMRRETAILAQLDFGGHFEFGFEPQRLALLEVHVFDIGPADHLQIVGLEAFLEILGDQAFEDVLPYFVRKARADNGGGDLSRAEAGYFSFFLNTGYSPFGLLVDFVDGDGDLY